MENDEELEACAMRKLDAFLGGKKKKKVVQDDGGERQSKKIKTIEQVLRESEEEEKAQAAALNQGSENPGNIQGRLEDEKRKGDHLRKVRAENGRHSGIPEYPDRLKVDLNADFVESDEKDGRWGKSVLRYILNQELKALKGLYYEGHHDVYVAFRAVSEKLLKLAAPKLRRDARCVRKPKLNPKNESLLAEEKETSSLLASYEKELSRWCEMERKLLSEKQSEQKSLSNPEDGETDVNPTMTREQIESELRAQIGSAIVQLKILGAKLRGVKKDVATGKQMASKLSKIYEEKAFLEYPEVGQAKKLIKLITGGDGN